LGHRSDYGSRKVQIAAFRRKTSKKRLNWLKTDASFHRRDNQGGPVEFPSGFWVFPEDDRPGCFFLMRHRESVATAPDPEMSPKPGVVLFRALIYR
jgi:hypothetical protein